MTQAGQRTDPAPMHGLDVDAIRAWVSAADDALGAAREEIDRLNVYPVPDGDTGTNLHLTMAAAAEATGDGGSAGPSGLLRTLARGALLGARGNSGVILSEMLRGLAGPPDQRPDPGDGSAEPPGGCDGRGLAAALRRGADAAYAAVADPVEGTMLSVARAAAEAADTCEDLADVVTAAARAAREALARTPEQLKVLRDAGVVDAGGRGVCVLLDVLCELVTGEPPPGGSSGPPGDSRAVRADDRRDSGPAYEADDADDGPAYEVMYLLDAQPDDLPGLRTALAPLGDSLLVAGSAPTWNVHVHVDDVGAAIEAGLAAGRPHRIRVTSLRDDVRAARRSARPGRAVVSVVAGDGLATLFETAGATVVHGGPGRRASTGELLAGLRRSGGRDVVVLPNDADSFGVARAAADEARGEGLHVAVVPTRASVQAIAALAVHDPERSFEEDVLAMTAAASHCRHGGVTVAGREAVTMAGVCREGDVLGVVDGDFALIGTDLGTVACQVVDRMLSSGGELVTLVTGDAAGTDLVDVVVRHLRRERPEVDTQVYEGGQPRYPLLLGVE